MKAALPKILPENSAFKSFRLHGISSTLLVQITTNLKMQKKEGKIDAQ